MPFLPSSVGAGLWTLAPLVLAHGSKFPFGPPTGLANKGVSIFPTVGIHPKVSIRIFFLPDGQACFPASLGVPRCRGFLLLGNPIAGPACRILAHVLGAPLPSASPSAIRAGRSCCWLRGCSSLQGGGIRPRSAVGPVPGPVYHQFVLHILHVSKLCWQAQSRHSCRSKSSLFGPCLLSFAQG